MQSGARTIHPLTAAGVMTLACAAREPFLRRLILLLLELTSASIYWRTLRRVNDVTFTDLT